MSRRTYTFQPAAQDDLNDHGHRLTLHVSDQAMVRFFREVFRTCTLLTTMPFIGRQVESDSSLREFGVRGSRGIRLIYRVTSDAIEIVRAVGRNQHWIP